MPPSPQIDYESLLRGAVDFVKEKGLDQVTARSLARHLGISTFPILQHFKSVKNLIREIQGAILGEIRQTQMALEVPEEYQKLFIGFTLYTWRHPKAYLAVRDVLGDRAWEEVQRACRESEKFKLLSEEQFYTVLIRLIHFNHGVAEYASRGLLYQPTEAGITHYILQGFKALESGEL